MRSAYYTCNLLPTGLMARCGYTPRWLGNHLLDPAAPARREALGVHPTTCPFVTQLVPAADALLGAAPVEDCFLVPGGCDAMRRMGDLLATKYPDQVFMLTMPRAGEDGAVRTLAADLARMETWLRQRLSTAPAGRDEAALSAAPAEAAPGPEPPRLEYPSPPRPGGVFVVAGPLSDDSLSRLIEGLGSHVSGLEACTSPDRWKPLATAGGTAAATTAGEIAGGAMDVASVVTTAAPPSADAYLALAAEILAIGVCPRRSTTERRDHLGKRLDEASPAAVIYARQSFCDPGAYDALLVSELARERNLPYLEIEVGFPFEASGPLRTRIEAFLESQSLDDDLLDGGGVDDYRVTGDAFDDDLFDDAVDEAIVAEGQDGPAAGNGW